MKAEYSPCSVCGRPTRSELGICAARSGPCHNARGRADRAAHPEVRRSIARRQRGKMPAGSPAVYAIWFPRPEILKVGFTRKNVTKVFIASARSKARRRNLDVTGSACVWLRPGDERTEAWIQATLAFKWPAALIHARRICEWFLMSGVTQEDITEILNEVYKQVPADVVKAVPVSEERGYAAEKPGHQLGLFEPAPPSTLW